MARVFLTGASGLLGRHVAPRLRAHGHQVMTLCRQPAADPDTVSGDLTRPESYAAALRDVDAIVHLAAVTGKAPDADYARVNIEGTRALLDAAREAGVDRLLFCSTIAVTFPDIRHYPYARSKAAGEQLVQASGLRTTTIRPTIASLAALPLVPLFGDGHTKVQPILVDDLADLVVDLIDAERFEGEVLECGGRDILSMRDLLAHLRRQRQETACRFLPIPLGLLLPPLRMLEAVFGSALPMTVGQLATFRFDGVTQPNSFCDERLGRLASLDRVLAQASPA